MEYAYGQAYRLEKADGYMSGGMLVKNEVTEWDDVNIMKKKSTMLGDINYSFDNIYQLTSYSNSTAEQHDLVYAYDAAGNRDGLTINGTLSNYSANDLNQLTLADGISTFIYDANGNMTGKGADTYSWDYNNRLVWAVVGANNISYKYNYQDIRLEKNNNGNITRYYYNGTKLLAEGDGTKITKIYTNDNEGVLGMTRKIYEQSSSYHYQSLYYLFDNLGSVAAITDDSGKPVQYYQYDPYGRITNAVTDPVNSLTFVGRYFGQRDWDTGFTYFWHRWYDADLGRWISRDPIGVKGGVNLMRYIKNNPITKIDSSGFCDGNPDIYDDQTESPTLTDTDNFNPNPPPQQIQTNILTQDSNPQTITCLKNKTFHKGVFSLCMLAAAQLCTNMLGDVEGLTGQPEVAGGTWAVCMAAAAFVCLDSATW